MKLNETKLAMKDKLERTAKQQVNIKSGKVHTAQLMSEIASAGKRGNNEESSVVCSGSSCADSLSQCSDQQ